MHTQTDLDKFQIHDIMGRIYGEIWRNSDRRKYTVKDIHDGKHSFGPWSDRSSDS